ncbi:MgtC family protein [compost metagenome]
MLVCLAACTFAVISLESVYMKGFFDQRVQIDPLRVVEAVTAGVAFLAAGTIVLSRGRVHGLTTGSSLWLAGAIGLTLGFGHWIIAAFATGSAFLVLSVVGRLEAKVKEDEQSGPDLQASKPRDEKAESIRKAGR